MPPQAHQRLAKAHGRFLHGRAFRIVLQNGTERGGRIFIHLAFQLLAAQLRHGVGHEGRQRILPQQRQHVGARLIHIADAQIDAAQARVGIRRAGITQIGIERLTGGGGDGVIPCLRLVLVQLPQTVADAVQNFQTPVPLQLRLIVEHAQLAQRIVVLLGLHRLLGFLPDGFRVDGLFDRITLLVNVDDLALGACRLLAGLAQIGSGRNIPCGSFHRPVRLRRGDAGSRGRGRISGRRGHGLRGLARHGRRGLPHVLSRDILGGDSLARDSLSRDIRARRALGGNGELPTRGHGLHGLARHGRRGLPRVLSRDILGGDSLSRDILARRALDGNGELPTRGHGLRGLARHGRRGLSRVLSRDILGGDSLARDILARHGLGGSGLRRAWSLRGQRLFRGPVFRAAGIDPRGDAFSCRCRMACGGGKNFQPGASAQHTNCRSHKQSAAAAAGSATGAHSQAGPFPSDMIPVFPGRKCLVHAYITSWLVLLYRIMQKLCKKHAKIIRSFSSAFR